ncbi:MAG: ribonuclease H-like domain-containing protein [Candidatus Taylorbacteria bacterium]|nr:ribonuclease H-like domain-containing protein [Candidatus Taylorbacteria bacterium]
MRKVFFDIETQNIFQDVGSNDPAALDLAVVGVYDSQTGDYQSFFESGLKNLWPVLESADMLIGFNSEHFDLPILNKYYPGNLNQIKHLDLMKEVKNVLGRRVSLNTLAKATLSRGKAGTGLEALVWWRNGEREKVCKYCLEDVKLTKELYDYALGRGHLKYLDGKKVEEIKLDTSKWEEVKGNGLTFSLPF